MPDQFRRPGPVGRVAAAVLPENTVPMNQHQARELAHVAVGPAGAVAAKESGDTTPPHLRMKHLWMPRPKTMQHLKQIRLPMMKRRIATKILARMKRKHNPFADATLGS